MSNPAPASSRSRRRSFRIAAAASAAFAATMFGVAFAAVPLYDWFCRVTGFGGTTQVAERAPDRVLDHTVTVRFDSNVSPALPWQFEAEVVSVQVRVGEPVTVSYTVRNTSSRPTTGVASFNVAPAKAGIHFHKIQCFCFTDQTLAPGESREMPVLFFVDPAIVDDPESKAIHTITLSYTFFPSRNPALPVADAGTGVTTVR